MVNLFLSDWWSECNDCGLICINGTSDVVSSAFDSAGQRCSALRVYKKIVLQPLSKCLKVQVNCW